MTYEIHVGLYDSALLLSFQELGSIKGFSEALGKDDLFAGQKENGSKLKGQTFAEVTELEKTLPAQQELKEQTFWAGSRTGQDFGYPKGGGSCFT